MIQAPELLAPYTPLPWQLAPLDDKRPVMLLVGGSGGGKSRCAAEKMHAYLLHYAGAVGLIVRKTREAANESCVPTMWKVMGGEKSGINWHKDTNTFHYPNGSVLYTRGLKDEMQRESMRSIGGEGGTDIIWAEEANKITEQDFNELLARNRHTAAHWQQIILTTNPDAPAHWINKRLIIGREASVYNSVATDNPYLPQSYLDNLQTLTGIQYQRLVKNKWVQAEGVIYDKFSASFNVTEEAEFNPEWPIAWGVDDGYARGLGKGTEGYHPRVFLLLQYTQQGGINVFAEYYKTMEREEDSLKNVLELPSPEHPYPAPEIAYVDSSAAQLKGRIWGMGISTHGATHVVTEGIKNMRRLVGDGNGMVLLKIHPRCVELIEEMQSYSTGENTAAVVGEVKPAKVNDHGPDALRYAAWKLRFED